jgi:hypothetical protein
MHPRDGVVVVVNVRNGLFQKVAGKVGWPENWWPTLVVAWRAKRMTRWIYHSISDQGGQRQRTPSIITKVILNL